MDWGRFEGCFARLDRAREHCVEFGAEWARYIEGHPAELSVHVDDSGRGTVSIVRYRPPPHRLSLLIGEFLYELRAALDNCLYETAVQYSSQDPPPGEGLLQFPIYDTAESWTRNLDRLRHLSDEHRAMLERIHVVGSVLSDGAMFVEAPPGSKVITQHKVDGVVVSHGVTEIASFTIEPWTPGQQVDVLAEIELEVEITQMTAERPWGSIDKRLTALHRAVFEYVEGLAAYALGWTEPITDENLPTHEDATHS